jgi:hypothetical protein
MTVKTLERGFNLVQAFAVLILSPSIHFNWVTATCGV